MFLSWRMKVKGTSSGHHESKVDLLSHGLEDKRPS